MKPSPFITKERVEEIKKEVRENPNYIDFIYLFFGLLDFAPVWNYYDLSFETIVNQVGLIKWKTLPPGMIPPNIFFTAPPPPSNLYPDDFWGPSPANPNGFKPGSIN